jgi:hypothetical protein
MIDVHATEVQALDEGKTVMFTLKTFDAECAFIEMNCHINSQNIDQLTAAMRRALALLDLES